MAARINQKLKLLYIIDILRRYTDDENPMNASEICERLEAMGVSAERKAIYNDIEMLCIYGYDIVKTRTPRFGYFLGSREFELPEIYLLADAVRSADFITPKKTRELVAKLDSMLSIGQANRRERSTYIDASRKCRNEEIYYNIDKINDATIKGKKITFTYIRRRLSDNKKIVTEEKVMTVSPYATLWQNDNYYLVGNNEKYDNLIHLRLDRMKSIVVSELPARDFREVSNYKENFDTADYAAKTFNMYGGVLKRIELRCSREILEQILDRFSDNVSIYDLSENTFSFSATAMLSDGLISWILQFGNRAEVISPPELRQKIVQRIGELSEVYSDVPAV